MKVTAHKNCHCMDAVKNSLPYLNEIKERIIYRLQQEFPESHDLVQGIIEDHFENLTP
jgi:hypothetical protein